MGNATKSIRQNRTLTVDFHDETTYFALLDNPKAFVELIFAFILPLCAHPPGGPYHLAYSVHEMQGCFHRAAPFRPALP